VLDDVSLRIAAGERVALVGPSGAGKSTLVNLLLRLYEPTAGRILIDGIDIRRYTRAACAGHSASCRRTTCCSRVSVRENIAYGRPDASADGRDRSRGQGRACARVHRRPAAGYDTELGERGANLSGGQRQRLCLARALVKEPPCW
jgi:ABC-type multidrug transport system fused ATPase/permease subunit